MKFKTITLRINEDLYEDINRRLSRELQNGKINFTQADMLRKLLEIGCQYEGVNKQKGLTEERYQTLFVYLLEILCVLRKVVNASDRELYLRALNDLDKMLIHHRNKEKNEGFINESNS